MATLLLRLAGPLQSWGAESKFEIRRTLGFPTKSGVIGLLAAAMGYTRDMPLDRLNALRFGIRIDKEGEHLRDYHIAKGEKPYITNRFYLADAVFLAGLESDDPAFLAEIEQALRHPAYPLYLGRRACPPTLPLLLGVRQADLLTALRDEPWQIADWRQKRADHEEKLLRILTDADNANAAPMRDLAVSFSKIHRKYTWRMVQDHGYADKGKFVEPTDHDAFAELG